MADTLRNGEALAATQHYRALQAVAEAMIAHHELPSLLADLACRLRQVLRFDCVCLRLYDPASDTLRLYFRQALPDLPAPAPVTPAADHPAGWVWQTQKPLIVSNLATETRWQRYREETKERLPSLCVLPLTTGRARVGTLAFGSLQVAAFDIIGLDFLRLLANLVAVAVENARAFDHIQELKDRLEKERIYLAEDTRGAQEYEDIVGESTSLRQVLKEVEAVAGTTATVLIRGETGTGKELIARALHQLSPRREQTFIKLNCAAIPTGLLESELFGHEKGAFTGATTQKVGRFELADGGTLFLDEVGDIPLELQPKLLRILQEQEFERLGGTRTLRVNVRLVAATNRDLPGMVGRHQFRGDLYYRLNVFPVFLPPLRERRDDIPRLTRTFTQRFARQLGKAIETITAEVMDTLVRYDWPGNIRELENVIERAVILSPGPALQIPYRDLQALTGPGNGLAWTGATLADAERERILCALREADGVVGGPNGAAARLGFSRYALVRKMKKLGIFRPR